MYLHRLGLFPCSAGYHWGDLNVINILAENNEKYVSVAMVRNTKYFVQFVNRSITFIVSLS